MEGAADHFARRRRQNAAPLVCRKRREQLANGLGDAQVNDRFVERRERDRAGFSYVHALRVLLKRDDRKRAIAKVDTERQRARRLKKPH
jgi:hypothetical protein